MKQPEIRSTPSTPSAESQAILEATDFLYTNKAVNITNHQAIYSALQSLNDASFEANHRTDYLLGTAFDVLKKVPDFRAYLENEAEYAGLLDYNYTIYANKYTMAWGKNAMHDYFLFKKEQNYLAVGVPKETSDRLMLEMPGDFTGAKNLAIAAFVYARRVKYPRADMLRVTR